MERDHDPAVVGSSIPVLRNRRAVVPHLMDCHAKRGVSLTKPVEQQLACEVSAFATQESDAAPILGS